MTGKLSSAHWGKRILLMFLSVLLAFTLLPLSPLSTAEAQEAPEAQASDKIMLQEGVDYASGEAIVVMQEIPAASEMGLFSTSLLDSAESLMAVTPTAYEEALSGEVASERAAAQDELAAMNAQDDLAIKLIRSSELSTEELLAALAEDPRVLMVQPNYLYQREPDPGALFDTEAYAQTISTLASTSEIADLTDYQWGNSNTSKTLVTSDKVVGFDMNTPEWEDNRTDPGATNATGVVAVVDTGVDYTHPDLAGSFTLDMRSYVSSGYGGQYGYCGVDGLPEDDPMDTEGHGTHCAGIIASSWNAYGTSGVASGVQLVAVRAANDEGNFTDAWAIKGYEYLAEAMRGGLDLKAVNNSWGGPTVSTALSVAVSMLGNLGAISVFASGNDATDNDLNPDTSAPMHSNPYTVVVNSMTMNETVSSFSNYGRSTTDVFAPGSSILSTYPMSLAAYLPEAVTDTSGLNILYESFTDTGSGTPQIETYADSTKATSIGAYNTTSYFDSEDNSGTRYSWVLSAADMQDGTVQVGSRTFDSKYMYAFIPIDTADQLDLAYLGFHASTEGNLGASGVSISFEATSPGGTIQLSQLSKGVTGSDWDAVSVNIEELCDEANAEPVFFNNDQLMVRIDFFAASGTPDNTWSYSIDAFGLGTVDAAVPYAYASGTSMAAPAVAGAAAVIALDEGSLGLSASELAQLRAAKLKGSTRDINPMVDLCTSGGLLDLEQHTSNPAKYRPVLNSIEVVLNSQNEYELTIYGFFFGTSGNVTISNMTQGPYKSWSENEVTLALDPQVTKSGLHNIRLTVGGETGQNSFIIDLPEYPNPSVTPLFETEYALPTADEGFGTDTSTVVMAGLAGKMFMAPVSTQQTTDTLFSLDASTGTWTKINGFPEQLLYASMTPFDGRLLITGVATSTSEQMLYAYDPLADAWETLAVSTIPYYASIINCNEVLYSVGGLNYDESTDTTTPNLDVLAHNLGNDTVTQAATLPTTDIGLLTQAHGEYLIVGDGNRAGKQGMLLLVSPSDGAVVDLEAVLPDFSDSRTNSYGIASVKDGLVISGVTGKTDGVNLDNTDTYALPIDSSGSASSATPASKQVSYAQIHNAASAAYGGVLYTFGYSYYEPGAYVLRATAFETLAQPGDIYTITYENVAQGEHSNATVYTGFRLPLTLSNAADRSDVRFAGWYDNDQFLGSAITQLTSTTQGNITLWAKWEKFTPPTPVTPTTPEGLAKTGDLSLAAVSLVGALFVSAGLILLVAQKRRKRPSVKNRPL